MTDIIVGHIEQIAAHAHLWGFLIVFVFSMAIMTSLSQKNDSCFYGKTEINHFPLKVFIKKLNTDLVFSSTGFFMNHDSNLFLVTTRHSIIDSSNSLRAPLLTVFQFSELDTIQLDFTLNKLRIKSTIPIIDIQEDAKYDIAIIFVGKFDPMGDITSFDIRKNVLSIKDLSVFDAVMLSGFPFHSEHLVR